jgi:hypothetical protein
MATNILGLTHIPLTRVELNKIKVRAIRRGLWFKVLSRVDRASIDLALKVVRRVRSIVLAKMLVSIIKKLLDAMENNVERMMKKVGRELAKKISKIAKDWGNKSAVHWATDPGFTRYLTIMCMNTPPMFRK